MSKKITYDRSILHNVIKYKITDLIPLIASIHIKIKDLWENFNLNEDAIKILINREEMYNERYRDLLHDYKLISNLQNEEEYLYLFNKYQEDIKSFNLEIAESKKNIYHGAYQKLTKSDILAMETNSLSLSKKKNI